VTLLEVVLSISLLVGLSSLTYWFYSSVVNTREVGTKDADKLRLVRVVLDQLSTEIRQASAGTADGRVGVRGLQERIWLSSIRVPSRELSKDRGNRELPPPGEYDLDKVEYKIARHPEILSGDGGWERPLGLARVEIRVPRPDTFQTGEAFEEERKTFGDEEAEEELEQQLDEQLLEDFEDEEGEPEITDAQKIQWEELYAPEIKYLRFCYYDGYQWWDTWEVVGENPLPQLVMITLGFDEHAPFEEARGKDKRNEEFCECLNREPPDCEPLTSTEYSSVVRVTQADPLFRSRVSRESQAFLEDQQAEEEEEEENGDQEGEQ